MSTKAVTVWLVLAIVLGAAAMILLRPAPPGGTPPRGVAAAIAPGTRIAEFSPVEVRRIVVGSGRAPNRLVIDRAPAGRGPLGADAEWLLSAEPVAGGGATTDSDAFVAPPWPLETARVQSLLRAMSETRAVSEPARDARLGDGATRVEVTLPSGVLTLALAERTLAGTGLVEVTGVDGTTRRALIEDKLHAVFTSPGPAGWRVTAPAAGIAADASRVRLEGGGSTVGLAKVGGRWGLTEPIGAAADPAAVQKLLGTLSGLRIAEFLDDGAGSATTGLERPRARVRIEADRRTIPPGESEPKIAVDALELAIGGNADGAGRRVHCSVNDARLVLLDAGTLADVSTDPAKYLWPTPTRASAADVGEIALDRLDAARTPAAGIASAKTFRRSGGAWTQVRRTSPGEADAVVAMADRDQRDVEAVVEFLTGEHGGPASAGTAEARPEVSLTAPEGFSPGARVTISSVGGGTLERVELASVRTGVVTVRTPAPGDGTKGVYRTYPVTRVPVLLMDVLGLTSSPAAPPPSPSAADMLK